MPTDVAYLGIKTHGHIARDKAGESSPRSESARPTAHSRSIEVGVALFYSITGRTRELIPYHAAFAYGPRKLQPREARELPDFSER